MVRNSNLRLLVFAGGLICAVSGGQTQAPAADPPASSDAPAAANKNAPEMATRDATPTFTSRSNLVLVRVVVRDREGRVNGTLQKEDFQLLDKGKAQFISRFSVEKTSPRKPEPAPAENAGQPHGPSAPERYIAYVFDDVHLSVGDLGQARIAAEKHLAELAPSSRAAIYTTSGVVTQDFTDDVALLRDTMRRIQPRSNLNTGPDCPQLTYYQADLIQNKNDQAAIDAATQDTILCANLNSDAQPPPPGPASAAATVDPTVKNVAQSMAQGAASRVAALGEQETRLSLKLLKDVVRRVAAMPGQRTVVLISPGFLLLNQHIEEMEILDRALRGNVIINTLNARGLFTFIPGGDASQGASNLGTMRIRTQYQKESASLEGDVLAELSDGTGGTWFHDNNDLSEGFKRIAAAPEYYYVLGFSPENLKFDGSYHNLKISLKKLAGLQLQARRGYFAPSHEVNAAQEAKRELEEAMFSRDEWHDIPVELHTQFFKSSDIAAKLSVLARIDVRQLSFKRSEGRNLDILTVASGIFDRNGNYISAVEKTVEMHLKDDTLAHRLSTGIVVKTPFDVTPGSYFVRVVVRDSEGQKMGALNGAVEIP